MKLINAVAESRDISKEVVFGGAGNILNHRAEDIDKARQFLELLDTRTPYIICSEGLEYGIYHPHRQRERV